MRLLHAGFVLTLKALRDAGELRSREDVIAGLDGNVCRCTGYKSIVEGGRDAGRRAGGGAGRAVSTAETAAPTAPADRIGRSGARKDASPKLRGQAEFAGDINVPQMVHGKVLRAELPRTDRRSTPRPPNGCRAWSPC